MRTLLYIVLALALVPGCTRDAAWPVVLEGVRAAHPDVRFVSTDSLAAWLDAAPRPVLLDVRTEDEFAVSHLDGALRVDPDLRDVTALDTLGFDRPIVTYCSIGYRSAALAEKLQAAGFTNVANLEGSIFMWANDGRPVYRGGRRVHAVHPYDAVWGRLLDADLHATEPSS